MMLVPAESEAGGLAFDAAGNLFVADGHSHLQIRTRWHKERLRC